MFFRLDVIRGVNLADEDMTHEDVGFLGSFGDKPDFFVEVGLNEPTDATSWSVLSKDDRSDEDVSWWDSVKSWFGARHSVGRTKTVENDYSPKFGYSLESASTFGSVLEFKLREEDTMSGGA
jgi:hypothetical protein